MVGRRTADKVLTPRVRALVIGTLALALIGGVVLLRLFKTEGFQVAAAAPAATVQPSAEPSTPAVDDLEEAPSTMDSTRALRAADRGNRLLAQGQVKSALSVLSEGSRVLPDNAELAHAYGAALWRSDSRDRALFQFRKALKLSPDNALYREDLGRALAAMGHTAEAARILQAPGLAAATLDAARAAAAAAEPGAPAPVGGDLGGAGNGSFKGRRSFTDADLRGGRLETPAPAPAPSPSEEPGR